LFVLVIIECRLVFEVKVVVVRTLFVGRDYALGDLPNKTVVGGC
jgi:hypothetical protein